MASMCGEPSTRWVLPVEMIEQPLWGDTFGVGAGLPRVALRDLRGGEHCWRVLC